MYFRTFSAPGIAVFPLETTLMLSQEPDEMMEKHPVEDGPLRN